MTNQPKLKFNPSFILVDYLERVSFYIVGQIFKGKTLHVLNSIVSYDTLLKQFKSLVQ